MSAGGLANEAVGANCQDCHELGPMRELRGHRDAGQMEGRSCQECHVAGLHEGIDRELPRRAWPNSIAPAEFLGLLPLTASGPSVKMSDLFGTLDRPWGARVRNLSPAIDERP
ncbi:MAG: cytochrome c3 family protein [Pirellulaceae bacterium]